MKFMTPASVQNLPAYMRQDEARRQRRTLEQEKQEQKERQKLASDIGYDFYTTINALSPEDKQNPQTLNKVVGDVVSKYKSNPLYDNKMLQAGMVLAQKATQESKEYQTYQKGIEKENIQKKDTGILAQLANPSVTEKPDPSSLSAPAQVGYFAKQATQKRQTGIDDLNRRKIESEILKNNRSGNGGSSSGIKYPIDLYKNGRVKTVYSADQHRDAANSGWRQDRMSKAGIDALEKQQELMAEAVEAAGGFYAPNSMQPGGQVSLSMEDVEPKDIQTRILAMDRQARAEGLKFVLDGQTATQSWEDRLQFWNDEATREITGQFVPIDKGGAFPKANSQGQQPAGQLKSSHAPTGAGGSSSKGSDLGKYVHVSRPEPVDTVETPEGGGDQKQSMLGQIQMKPSHPQAKPGVGISRPQENQPIGKVDGKQIARTNKGYMVFDGKQWREPTPEEKMKIEIMARQGKLGQSSGLQFKYTPTVTGGGIGQNPGTYNAGQGASILTKLSGRR